MDTFRTFHGDHIHIVDKCVQNVCAFADCKRMASVVQSTYTMSYHVNIDSSLTITRTFENTDACCSKEHLACFLHRRDSGLCLSCGDAYHIQDLFGLCCGKRRCQNIILHKKDHSPVIAHTWLVARDDCEKYNTCDSPYA